MNLYQLLTPDEASSILTVVRGMDWSQGKARTKELEGTVKQNLEILPEGEITKKLSSSISKKLVSHKSIQLNHIPIKVHPPKFSLYREGGHYKAHTDAPWMGTTRTDLSCTIWLSAPDTYEGGELCMNGQKIKGKSGQCLVYECGDRHEVKPVTSGERVCAVMWIQSRIRDSHKRTLVSNFRKFLAKLEPEHKDWFVEGGAIHSSLIRMWME